MFTDPSCTIAHFELREGDKVADFGAGGGAFTFALARAVGERGKVYAIEVQQGLAERLSKEACERKLFNIHPLWGDVEKPGGTTLADGSADLVLIANVLFLSDAKYTLALEAKRILRSGGRAAVVEWQDSFGGLGPSQERIVSVEEAKRIFSEAGFEFIRQFPAGEHHYGLLFSKTSG